MTDRLEMKAAPPACPICGFALVWFFGGRRLCGYIYCQNYNGGRRK